MSPTVIVEKTIRDDGGARPLIGGMSTHYRGQECSDLYSILVYKSDKHQPPTPAPDRLSYLAAQSDDEASQQEAFTVVQPFRPEAMQ